MSVPASPCSKCYLRKQCLFYRVPGVAQGGADQILESALTTNIPIVQGERIYGYGSPFKYFYMVKSGSVKCSLGTSAGEELIVDLCLPGDIFGLDGLNDARHSYSAVALEKGLLCKIRFETLELLITEDPGLLRTLLRLMGQKFISDLRFVTSRMSTDKRIAHLLINLSKHNGFNTLPATRVRLPMTRADMGNYLGMALETVSRILSIFQKNGIIDVHGKHVEILDPEALNRVLMADREFDLSATAADNAAE